MGKSYFLFIFAILSLILFECKKHQENTDRSQYNYDKALLDSIKKLDSLSFVNRLTHNLISQQYADKAITFSSALNNSEGYIIAWSAKANSFPSSSPDSEYLYLTKALKLSDQSNILTHKPNLLSNLALLYYFANNSQKALLLLDSCIILAEKLRNYEIMSFAYNELGNIHYDLMDYLASKRFYDSSYVIAQKHSFIRESGVALGSLAKLEKVPEKKREMGKKAASYLQKCKTAQDGLAGIFINIGYTFLDQDSAISYYNAALKITTEYNLQLLEIAAYNNLTYSYLDKGLINEAKSCLIDHAIPLAKTSKNLDWLSTLYDSYSDVLSASSNFKEAIKYEKKSVETGMDASKQAAASQVRLLSAMLDLKNKEVLIQTKNQEIEKHELKERMLMLWFAIAGLAIIILVIVVIVTNLNNKFKLQKQKAESSRRIIEIEENEKRKLSMNLHDLSGQVKMELLNQFSKINIPAGTEKTEMENKINALSNQIRTISHRMSKITINQFDIGTLIQGLCAEFKEFSGLVIHFSKSDNIPDLTDEIKLHIFRILQEILTNATKYAKNTTIKINISTSASNFVLVYSDNGPGFTPQEVKNKGLGLINIYERTKILGGEVKLESNHNLGVYWEISIPLKLKTTQILL
jgi:signal transduction histidine kinase